MELILTMKEEDSTAEDAENAEKKNQERIGMLSAVGCMARHSFSSLRTSASLR
jgi:hypothetical protein